MSDQALKNALSRLQELDAKAVELRERIHGLIEDFTATNEERERLRAFIATWHDLAGKPQPAEVTEPAQQAAISLDGPKRVRPINPDRDVVVKHAREIIREHGAPMSRRALFDALTAQGIEINGKDPEMVLSTMLWRSKNQIVRLKSHGYWLADQPYKPAGWDPQLFDL